MTITATETADAEGAVRDRYSAAAKAPEGALCCPTPSDARLLEAVPAEVLERDYGCGDPSRHVAPGETVIDLGSGAGKNCFLASQIVGREGTVIGIDMNDEMLAVARRNVDEVARRVGHANVSFRKGRIQDLALDVELLDRHLAAHPVRTSSDLARLESEMTRLRREHPLIADGSADVVLSNCVLNLVRPDDKAALFREMFRVLRRGGRAVISDIVSDEDVPEALQSDPELWSGCISGAYREDLFLAAFEEVGFYGVTLVERQRDPWRIVAGIEFRSVTVTAFKGKEGPCIDHKQAVIYRGPFREVVDDDQHTFRRGVPTAVCEKTFRIFSRVPYRTHVELVPPRVAVTPEAAVSFPCAGGAIRRDPRETKGADHRVTTDSAPAAPACGPSTSGDGSCC